VSFFGWPVAEALVFDFSGAPSFAQQRVETFAISLDSLFSPKMSPVLFLSLRPVATLAPTVLLSGEVHQNGHAAFCKANDGKRSRPPPIGAADDQCCDIPQTLPIPRINSPLHNHRVAETFKFALPNGANYSTHPAEQFSVYLTENKRWVYKQSDTLFQATRVLCGAGF
jgi:hypothetical protein